MRSPRRSFAAPFVVTLAAIPACTVTPAPPPRNPPTATVVESRPQTATVVESPRPNENPPPPRDPPIIHGNPPPPVEEPIPTPPPEGRWLLTMSGGKCHTQASASCPQPKPGGPRIMCNPPAPHAYECPSGMTDGASVQIVAAGAGCQIPPPATHCPPKAMCNPPPPRRVPCPQ